MKTILMWLGICLCSGCSFIIRPALVPNRNVEKWTVVDPNDYGITPVKQDNGSSSYRWNWHAAFDPNKATIPYSGSIVNLNPATVKGQLNGRTYDVIFDTGASPAILIEDSQINRHNLPVLFINPKNKQNSGGLAFANLNIGPLSASGFPCLFFKQHAEHRVLGLVPIHRFEWIIVPLDLMRQFGYIEFDQIKKELRISEKESFTPTNWSEWIKFPFTIQEAGVASLLLKIHIEGMETTLHLDTGANYALRLDSQIVQHLYDQQPQLRKAWISDTKTYGPYCGGIKKAKQFTARKIIFGNRNISKVQILTEESTGNQPFEGTIGIGLFRKTVMVLDFKQSLMWVKKAKGSRFEDISKEKI